MTELSGTLEGVGLPAIVRFLTGLKKTGCLRLTQGDWHGEIFFDAGQVTSASFGSRHGLAALDALVQALPSAHFAFDSEAHAAIDAPIALSAEAFQTHLDELDARPSTLPAADAIPQVV